MQTEQPFKTGGILDYEVKLWFMRTIIITCAHADASKSKGIDPEAMESRGVVNQQALDGGAPGNQAVNGAL
jgi:hypothetical protein